MSLADYLAKNYLTADPSSPKKKRKKTKHHTSPPSGLIIADDSLSLSGLPTKSTQDDEDGPLIYGGSSSAEFRKAKTSTWRTIGAPPPSNSDQAAADAILAAAASESSALKAENDAEDAPAVVSDDNDDNDGPRMESGERAGLQTAEQTAAIVAAQERQRKKDPLASKPQQDGGQGEETIYRDASGRIINIAMKRAEARRLADEKSAKEARENEAQKGDVQRAQLEKRKEDIKEAKYMTLSRYEDDEVMNDELRERERWNDPAAQFLSQKKGGGKSVSGKPVYKGAWMPNRYGIRPGYRWDGVDRGNGFEKEWFQARSRRERVGRLEYEWQMDE